MTIGEMILERRQSMGISRRRLSRESGVDVTVIWNIECGYTMRPRNVTLARIADALGMTLAEFELEKHPARRRKKGGPFRFGICREAAGLTREQAAEIIGVELRTIYNWESGASNPTVYQMIAMSKLYGVTLDYLLATDLVPYFGRRCKLGPECAAGRQIDYCCADCPERERCGESCLNDPEHCGQVKGR